MNEANVKSVKNKVPVSRQKRMNHKPKKLKTYVVFFVAILCLSSILVRNCALTASAGTTYKYYTSLKIQDGDSLWSIAQNYKTKEYSSIQSYIEEVKQINHLRSDRINEDQYLCIPYYASELK